MKTIDIFCLTVLITLFPSLQNTYSLDVAKLVRGIEYFIAQISAYIYSTNDYKHGGVYFCRENNGDEFHYTRQFANMN
jgi:hypothetical protein